MKKSLFLLFFLFNSPLISAQKIPKQFRGEWKTQYIVHNPLLNESTQHNIYLNIEKQTVTFQKDEIVSETYAMIKSDSKDKIGNELTIYLEDKNLKIQLKNPNQLTLSLKEQDYVLRKKIEGNLPVFEINSEEDYLHWWQTYDQVLQNKFSEKRKEILALQEGGLFLPSQTYQAWQVIEQTFLELESHPIKSWETLQQALEKYAYPESVSLIVRIDKATSQTEWQHDSWSHNSKQNDITYQEQISFEGNSISFVFRLKENNKEELQKINYSFFTRQGSQANTGQIIIKSIQETEESFVCIPYHFLESEKRLTLYKGQVFNSYSKANSSTIILDSSAQKTYEITQ